MIRRYFGWRVGALVTGCALGALVAGAPAQAQTCVGDCNGDGMVAINELIIGVNIALGSQPISACPSYDVNGNGMVTVDELIRAVNNALNGCPVVNTPTATFTLPAGTATATVTATLPAGTATATITDTPDQANDTPTPTATPEPTSSPLGSNVCTLGAGSQLYLQTAALALPLMPTGTFSIECGERGSDGTADCSCELMEFGAVVIPAIGDVCVNPATGCDPGTVDCDGGATIDVSLNADHNIGTCANNNDCESACEAHCSSLGAGFTRQSHGCEGYCLGGSNDGAECSRDTDCPGGNCTGGEPVTHADTCNCTCSATGIGDPSAAGGLACNLGTQINVELPNSGVCGDRPPTIQLAPVCGGVTTETSTGVVLHSNNSATDSIPLTGPESVDGALVSCETFSGGTITGLKLVGQLGFYDSTLGDIRARNTFVCQ